MVVQKLKKTFTQMEAAIAYYSVISDLNNLRLTQREIQLTAFAAVRGSINNPAVREDFCSLYKTSQATIYNLIVELKKKGILVKGKGKVKINPSIALDFTTPILMQITLNYAS